MLNLLWVLFLSLLNICISSPIGVVSIFRPDESLFLKYAAVLATTEPLRIDCDREIKKSINPFVLFWETLKGQSVRDPSSNIRIENKDVDNACIKYEKSVDDIVKSYGMNVDTFNALSSRLIKEPKLKQKVLRQAYYYRISADLTQLLKKSLPVLPAIDDSRSRGPLKLPNFLRPRAKDETEGGDSDPDYGAFAYPAASDSKLTSFFKVLRNVEIVRCRVRDNLKATLGITDLPEDMCDARVYPAMHPLIQAACQNFPKSADAIISHHGLDTDEFNSLQAKVENDFFFRMRVRRGVSLIDREIKGKK